MAVSVVDLGDGYRVVAGDRAKTYADPARDCTERARVAATFIALALNPELAPPPSPPPPAPTATATVPPPEPPVHLRVDASAALAFAPGEGLLAPGIVLGVAVERERWGARLTCGWFAGASEDLPGASGQVALERFPCTLGPEARFEAADGVLDVDLDVALAMGALRTSGRGFASDLDATRLEVGGRAGAEVALNLNALHLRSRTGFAPQISAGVTYFPMTYNLGVMPLGFLASTPHVWADVTAGIRWTTE